MPQKSILNKRLLQQASFEREQANLHFHKSDRIKSITVITFVFGILFALFAYFVAAGVIISLSYVLALFAGHSVRNGDKHWDRSHQLVRQARHQAKAQAQVTRDGIGAGENPAQKGQALVPLFNTNPGDTPDGSR